VYRVVQVVLLSNQSMGDVFDTSLVVRFSGPVVLINWNNSFV
jgi:hypothetical protein